MLFLPHKPTLAAITLGGLMPRRLIKIIAALLLMAIPTFIVVNNPTTVQVKTFGETPLSVSVGVLMLVVFIIGALSASLVASVLGLFSWWERRKLQKREQLRIAFLNAIIDARSATASHEWSRAKNLWLGILKKDSQNVIARIELSRIYQRLGDQKEALAVVEAVRATYPEHVELLFQIADLLVAAGNLTAAFDNISVLLTRGFNARAASRAVELLERLGRWEDALEQWERLDDNGGGSIETGARIKFHLLTAKGFVRPEDELTALLEFIKKFPFYSPAYERLAEVNRGIGNMTDSAHALIKGAKGTRNFQLYRQAIEAFLGQPAQGVGGDARRYSPDTRSALAAARSAVASVAPECRITARLLLASVHVRLEETNEAEDVLRDLREHCRKEGITMRHQEQIVQLCLQGMILTIKGRDAEARRIWREVLREAMQPGSTDSEYDYINGTGSLPQLGQEAAPGIQFGAM
jgi:tetratricopeptide (TPR) repeat protein